MRLYKAVILANLALGVGLLGGYLWWGRDVARLGREVVGLTARLDTREGAVRSWSVNGIVRSAPDGTALVIITHEAMPGLMGAMTMAFRAADRSLIAGLQPGARVRFTVVATDKDLFVVALRRE